MSNLNFNYMNNNVAIALTICIIACGWDIYAMIWNIKRKNNEKAVIFLFLSILMIYCIILTISRL